MTYYQYIFLRPNENYSGLDLNILGNKQDINCLKGTGIIESDPEYKPAQDQETYVNDGKTRKDSDAIKQELKERYHAYKQAEENKSLDLELLKDEYEDLMKTYNSLYDLHGEARDATAPNKKAIKAVAKNLRTAKENILEYLPELAELLKDVKTGNSFGYIPSNPDKPIEIITEHQK